MAGVPGNKNKWISFTVIARMANLTCRDEWEGDRVPKGMLRDRYARLSLSRMHLDGATSHGSSFSSLEENSDDRNR